MNAHDISILISGAILLGHLVAAALFWRFWRQTHERLFVYFAIAFTMLAAERVLLVAVRAPAEHSPHVYFTRLAAFLIILWAIWEKNRPRRT